MLFVTFSLLTYFFLAELVIFFLVNGTYRVFTKVVLVMVSLYTVTQMFKMNSLKLCNCNVSAGLTICQYMSSNIWVK